MPLLCPHPERTKNIYIFKILIEFEIKLNIMKYFEMALWLVNIILKSDKTEII